VREKGLQEDVRRKKIAIREVRSGREAQGGPLYEEIISERRDSIN